MTRPAVSVIMPAYNGAALLPATLESLRRQTLPDWEAIVVDDCSTDDTLAVLHGWDDPRVRVFKADCNGGPVAARNIAMTHATGRHIAGLDQDDLCKPERFARQVAWLDAHPETLLVASAADVLQEDGRILPSRLPPVTTPVVLDWLVHVMNPIVWSTVMIRGEAARALNPFERDSHRFAEDFDLTHRLARQGRIARIDAPLLTYRNHSGGASQRYIDGMTASATAVLAESYAAPFGDRAPEMASLVVRHIMRRLPVVGREALNNLGDGMRQLQQWFVETRDPDPDSLALIRWETARLWARIGQDALRAGGIGISDTLAVRPDHLGLGHAGLDDFLKSSLARAVKHRRI